MAYTLSVNGEERTINVAADTPLLWVLRESLDLTGTKFGCGIGLCGACTVHLDGQPIPSCSITIEDTAGQDIRTIEDVAERPTSPAEEAIVAAWEDLDVVQCGYCQPGQVMAAVALLSETPKPTDEDVDIAMAGHVCRCATYVRVRAAIHAAAEKLGG